MAVPSRAGSFSRCWKAIEKMSWPGLAPWNPSIPFTRMEIKVASAGTQERRWLRWSIHALYDGDGKLREYQAVGQDVTEGKKLEEALQVAESNLRQMIVSNADGMVVAG
jgi:PAS domain-containing protein